MLQPKFDVCKDRQNVLVERAFTAPKSLPVRLIRNFQRNMGRSNDGRERMQEAVENVIVSLWSHTIGGASTKSKPAKD